MEEGGMLALPPENNLGKIGLFLHKNTPFDTYNLSLEEGLMLFWSDPHRPHTSQPLGPDANFAFRRCDAIIWGR